MPTPCRFDFTWAVVSGFENDNRQVQSVTNFLNPVKSGPGKPGPYKSMTDYMHGHPSFVRASIKSGRYAVRTWLGLWRR